jgi:hypothetical protein
VYRVRRVDLYLVQCCGGVPGTGRWVCTWYNIGEMYQVQGIEFVPGTFLLSRAVSGTIERDCAWHRCGVLFQAQKHQFVPGTKSSKGRNRARLRSPRFEPGTIPPEHHPTQHPAAAGPPYLSPHPQSDPAQVPDNSSGPSLQTLVYLGVLPNINR